MLSVTGRFTGASSACAGPANPIAAAAVGIHTAAIGQAFVIHVYALLPERAVAGRSVDSVTEFLGDSGRIAGSHWCHPTGPAGLRYMNPPPRKCLTLTNRGSGMSDGSFGVKCDLSVARSAIFRALHSVRVGRLRSV